MGKTERAQKDEVEGKSEGLRREEEEEEEDGHRPMNKGKKERKESIHKRVGGMFVLFLLSFLFNFVIA